MNNYKLQIKNEKTGKIFSECIDSGFITVIDDDKWDEFLDYMENKYNATMDFTGEIDFARYTIHGIDDESVFEDILKEWHVFFTTEQKKEHSEIVNKIRDSLSQLGITDDMEIDDNTINNIMGR